MEDFVELSNIEKRASETLEKMAEEFSQKLKVLLWGESVLQKETPAMLSIHSTASAELASASPKQIQKKPKRLTSLREEDEQKRSLKINSVMPLANCYEKLPVIANAVPEPMQQEDAETLIMLPPQPPKQQVAVSAKKTITVTPTESNSVVSISEQPSVVSEYSFTRPQRAAKIKCEKNLKEPKLTTKLRRPDDIDIKKEPSLENTNKNTVVNTNESQLAVPQLSRQSSNVSITSTKSDNSCLLVAAQPPLVNLISEDDDNDDDIDDNASNSQTTIKSNAKVGLKNFCIQIKREKLSISATTSVQKEDIVLENGTTALVASNIDQTSQSSSQSSSTLSANTTEQPKRNRKKKNHVVKPIKVERFSDIDKQSEFPIAARTRKGNLEKQQQQQQQEAEEQQPQPAAVAAVESQNKEKNQVERSRQRSNSIYEDAMEEIQPNVTKVTEQSNVATAPVTMMNETVAVASENQTKNYPAVVAGNIPNTDATFCANPQASATFVTDPNATVTLKKIVGQEDVAQFGDATFNVALPDARNSVGSSNHSLKTAKETLENSLITEDESFERPLMKKPEKPTASKPPINAKTLPFASSVYKMAKHTKELFNPLVQSPVKMKVRAFESAAQTATEDPVKSTRLRQMKENFLAGQNATPSIGKVNGIGRFLTPTQSSNMTPSVQAAAAKKAPNSTSKIMPFPKATSNALKSTLAKNLSRENSAEEMRKAFLQQAAEERRKQREQKHILAAQQREAKEKERAERMAKLNKEREEKRLKKKQEIEQRKKEVEEINRKLQAQEAEELKAKVAKAKIANKETEMLAQAKPQQNKKPTMGPPKPQTRYTFEMLHEYDSTDEEGKVTVNRPQPPTWSLSHVRGPAIRTQQCWPTDVIDSFFSVQPMTPDLQQIFPNIDKRHLKRNSSAFWSTPPRYSELPKY